MWNSAVAGPSATPSLFASRPPSFPVAPTPANSDTRSRSSPLGSVTSMWYTPVNFVEASALVNVAGRMPSRPRTVSPRGQGGFHVDLEVVGRGGLEEEPALIHAEGQGQGPVDGGVQELGVVLRAVGLGHAFDAERRPAARGSVESGINRQIQRADGGARGVERELERHAVRRRVALGEDAGATVEDRGPEPGDEGVLDAADGVLGDREPRELCPDPGGDLRCGRGRELVPEEEDRLAQHLRIHSVLDVGERRAAEPRPDQREVHGGRLPHFEGLDRQLASSRGQAPASRLLALRGPGRVVAAVGGRVEEFHGAASQSQGVGRRRRGAERSGRSVRPV